MPSHTCDCINPPGGRVTCQPGQLAICHVRNGRVHASCHTPSRRALASQRALQDWILERVLEQTGLPQTAARAAIRSISPSERRRIIADGRYQVSDDEVITFSDLEDEQPGGEQLRGVPVEPEGAPTLTH